MPFQLFSQPWRTHPLVGNAVVRAHPPRFASLVASSPSPSQPPRNVRPAAHLSYHNNKQAHKCEYHCKPSAGRKSPDQTLGATRVRWDGGYTDHYARPNTRVSKLKCAHASFYWKPNTHTHIRTHAHMYERMNARTHTPIRVARGGSFDRQRHIKSARSGCQKAGTCFIKNANRPCRGGCASIYCSLGCAPIIIRSSAGARFNIICFVITLSLSPTLRRKNTIPDDGRSFIRRRW